MKIGKLFSMLVVSVFVLSACSTKEVIPVTDNVPENKSVMDNEVPTSKEELEDMVSSRLVPPKNSPFPDNPNLEVDFDTNRLKDIYLAGGCFWGVEAYMSRIYGVYDVTSGYANGNTLNPSYQDVLAGSGHAETVHIQYDPSLSSLETLLNYFFYVVDPTSINRQGNDVGPSYRSGIYYTDESDLESINQVQDALEEKYEKQIVVEVEPLRDYTLAEEYHQDYLEKNPDGYCHIEFDPLETQEVPVSTMEETMMKDEYKKPSDEELKETLTDLQYTVTQEATTERPFDNLYWNNHEPGIYLDVVTGEPLFTSTAKYDSGTGWPAFYATIDEEALAFERDTTFGMDRVEVKSKNGETHLGHIFNDGPEEFGGVRYCINSASLLFIPYEEMEEKGFGHLMYLIDVNKDK
jgi:peptide methionine sulfoxide reductase msrA/msrB